MNMTTSASTKLQAGQRTFFQKHANILVVYGLIILLLTIGTLSSERFFTLRNLTNVAQIGRAHV